MAESGGRIDVSGVPGEFQTLVDAGRYGEADQRYASMLASRDHTPQVAIMRAELARAGRGPVTELLLTGRRMRSDGDERGEIYLADAARHLARAGATDVADAIAEESTEKKGLLKRKRMSEHIEFLSAQIDLGCVADDQPAALAARKELAAGRPDNALTLLRDAHRSAAVLRNQFGLAVALAAVERGRRDHASAASALDKARDVWPEADDTVLLGARRGLDLWAGGAPDALEELKKVRAATLDVPGGREHEAHALVVAVIDAAERDDVANHVDWHTGKQSELACPLVVDACDGLAVLLGADAALLADVPGPPSVARLRWLLACVGVATSRVRVTERNVADLLDAGTVIVEIELSVGTGLRHLVDWDPVGRLLLLRDPLELGPELVPFDEFETRASLHASGALVVGGSGEGPGLSDDEALVALDRCVVDDEGKQPSPALAVVLAVEALALDESLTLARKIEGEGLLSQLQSGGIQAAPDGRFEQWVSEARPAFPDDEWPFQIYADGLLVGGRPLEALMAWAQALALDPDDWRNYYGSAQCRAESGDIDEAVTDLRRAAALNPAAVEVYALWGSLALSLDRVDEAAIVVEVYRRLAPDDPNAEGLRSVVQQQRGDLAGARSHLEKCLEIDPETCWAYLRLTRLGVRAGDWDAAWKAADDHHGCNPANPGAWVEAASVTLAEADAESTYELVKRGLNRCGPAPVLVDMAGQILATLLPLDLDPGPFEQISEAVGWDNDAALALATQLSLAGQGTASMRLMDRAVRNAPDDPQPLFALAKLLLGDATRRDLERSRIDSMLEVVVERTSHFTWARCLFGWQVVGGDPERALELAQGADIADAPALVWQLAATALDALDRTSEADEVRARLPESYPAGVIAPARFLRETGWFEPARSLLEGALADHPHREDLQAELAYTMLRLGGADRALALLRPLVDSPSSPVTEFDALVAARGAKAWAEVVDYAGHIVDSYRRDSRIAGDSWPFEAQRAMGCLALGSSAERDRVLEAAPRHPHVVFWLAALGEGLDGPGHRDDLDRLRRVSPGGLTRLERGVW